MIDLRFGGSISDVIDANTGAMVAPRCMGEARIEVRDRTAYDLGVSGAGGEEAFSAWVQRLAIQCVSTAFGALAMDRGVLASMADEAALIESATQTLAGELAPMGVTATISTLTILLSQEDKDALTAASP